MNTDTYDWLADPFAFSSTPPQITAFDNPQTLSFTEFIHPRVDETGVVEEEVEEDDDEEEEEDDDTTYVTKKGKKPRGLKASKKSKRKTRALTEEQKTENKRKREDDRTIVSEMRAFLSESTKKQKTVQQVIETTNNKMNTMQAQSPSEYILYLTKTVATQQTLIQNMNLEIFNMGTKYRSELVELDLKHRQEVEQLNVTIAEYKEREAAIQLRINEWRSQRTRLLEELENLKTQGPVTISPPIPPSIKVDQARGSIAPNSQSPKAARVKPEPGAPNDTMENATHYTWLVVEECNARCIDLYGFTAQQITEICKQLCPPTRKCGPKATYGDKQMLLMALFHFTHYTTIRVIHEKFGASTTTIASNLARLLSKIATNIFHWSLPAQPITGYVRGVYFLTIQTPKDTNVAHNTFDEGTGQHGIWIHCIHCSTTGKAVAYYTGNKHEMDAQWLTQFSPLSETSDTTSLSEAYENRMKGKFGLAASRFRGTLQEMDNTVRTLLALTNLDLGYDNPLKQRTELELTQ